MTRTALFAKPEVKETLVELRRVVRNALPDAGFAEREEAMLAIFDEAGRGVLEEDLQAIADDFGDRLLVAGVEYKRHHGGVSKYHCLSGILCIRRHTYRRTGTRNGRTVVPLELVTGLAEGATPALAYNVMHGYGQRDMRQHAEALLAAHRLAPPRATLERMAKRLAKEAVKVAPRIEAVLRLTEALPDGARSIAIGLDRTSVPMAEKRPSDASPKPEKKRRKPHVRRRPPPFDVNFRMAYVGTVSIADENGQALLTRRYAAPAGDEPGDLVKRMTADVRAALRRAPTLSVGTVQDGAPEMWNLTREGLSKLQREGVIANWSEGIDRYHLLERLAKALEIIEPDSTKRAKQRSDWNARLDTQDSAIDSIEQHLERCYVDLPAKEKLLLREHLVYLANNKDRMRYVTLTTNCLPVGSGVTESSAKTVIGRRAKNSGQHWGESGLRGALTVRAVHQSDRLPGFWRHLSRRYTATVEAA